LSYGDEGTRRLYVGDFDGRLWELDAVTGVNVNYQATGCSGNCNLAAFDTGGTLANPQPITSNISIAKVPPAATGDFANYAEESIVIFGTAGSSLVPPSVGGSIHALLSAQNRRKPVQADGVHLDGSPWSATAAMADAQVSGMLQAPANWPKNLTPPERVYGTISVAGKTVIVPAVAGSVNLGDVAHAAPAASLAGKTYTFNLGNITGTGAALASFDYANFGGVAIYHQALSSGSRDFVLTTEVNKIATYNVTNAGALGDISPDATLNPNANHGITYRLLNWFKRLLH